MSLCGSVDEHGHRCSLPAGHLDADWHGLHEAATGHRWRLMVTPNHAKVLRAIAAGATSDRELAAATCLDESELNASLSAMLSDEIDMWQGGAYYLTADGYALLDGVGSIQPSRPA